MFDVGQSVQTLGEMIGTLIGPRIEIVTHGPDAPASSMPMPAVRDRDDQHGGQRA
jgi:hypothetical protein